MKWTEKEDNRLAKMYSNKSNKDVAGAMGRTVGSVSSRATRNHLSKSARYVAKMHTSRKAGK